MRYPGRIRGYRSARRIRSRLTRSIYPDSVHFTDAMAHRVADALISPAAPQALVVNQSALSTRRIDRRQVPAMVAYHPSSELVSGASRRCGHQIVISYRDPLPSRSLRARSTLLPNFVTSPTNWSYGWYQQPASAIARLSFAGPRERGLGAVEATLGRFLPNRPPPERARVGRPGRVIRQIDALNAQIGCRRPIVRLAVERSAVLRCE